MLFIGYFEGLSSERGIAWRVADSLSLRSFLDLDVTEASPDHSTLSRTRRLIDVETHEAVFTWILERLSAAGLLRGKAVGVDATTLEANAAMRSIERRDTGESYAAFIQRLAEASGVETPTRADLLGGGPEQDPVDDGGILQGDRRDHLRHGEDDVEVLAVEQFRGAGVDPSRPRQRLTRGAMPVAATVVPDPLVSTAVACLDMAAERRGPTLLDRGHHTQVRGRQRGPGPGTIHGAVAAEDLRHAKDGTSHGGPPSVRGDRRGLRPGQQVERARGRTDLGGRQPEVGAVVSSRR